MEFETTIAYGSGIAWYRITREKPGIYYAVLLLYDGSDQQSPPADLTLVRAIRAWTGSTDDHVLINGLGGMIEAHVQHMGKKEKQKL